MTKETENNQVLCNIDVVSDYYELKDDEEVMIGDEYFVYDEWIPVQEINLPYVFYIKVFYRHRRKI